VRPKVFLTHTPADRRYFFPASSLDDLRSFSDVALNDRQEHLSPAQLLAAAPDADFVITEWATGADAAYFDSNRKLVAIARVGVEILNIDIEAATRHGVLVLNLPGVHQTSVIETTLAYMILMARKVLTFDRELRSGRIPLAYNVGLGLGMDLPEPGFDICGSTVGLVGLGFIGTGLAQLLTVMGARVLAYDPYVSQPPASAELTSLDELLSRSNIVSLHSKLTPETRHIIGRRELEQMQTHAYLVNTARGELVDNAALAWALREGVIAGAAVDVFDSEPDIANHELLSAPNCLVTPHMTGHTPRTMKALADGAVDEVRKLVVGERPKGVVNPVVLDSEILRWRPALTR
jgi:D-3-phosphoglycerate dehydrogenase